MWIRPPSVTQCHPEARRSNPLAISGNQHTHDCQVRQSITINVRVTAEYDKQCQAMPSNAKQWQSMAISSNQWQSVAIHRKRRQSTYVSLPNDRRGERPRQRGQRGRSIPQLRLGSHETQARRPYSPPRTARARRHAPRTRARLRNWVHADRRVHSAAAQGREGSCQRQSMAINGNHWYSCAITGNHL